MFRKLRFHLASRFFTADESHMLRWSLEQHTEKVKFPSSGPEPEDWDEDTIRHALHRKDICQAFRSALF